MKPLLKKEPSFISIHGNIQYDFLYRSFIDTPYSQRDYQQHTVQTNLTVTVRDKYPIRINIATRLSNSPYFSNFLDAGARFDKYAYLKNSKQLMLDKLSRKYASLPDLNKIRQILKELQEKYNALKDRIKPPDINQKIIEDREREVFKREAADANITVPQVLPLDWGNTDNALLRKFKSAINGNDSKNTSMGKAQQELQKQEKELDSLQHSIQQLQARYDSLQNSVQGRLASVRQKIYKASTLQELKKVSLENNISESGSSRFEKFLTNVRSIGIGRTILNYSELAAWDVALTGAHIEYNSNFYAAVAVGKIDYGFRDFFGKNTRQKGQQMAMIRLGLGDVNRRAILLSMFTGRKYSYGSMLSDTITNYVNVMGYALEAILKKDEHTGLSVELAKTTRPVSGSFQQNNELKSLVNFSDQSNLGISIKGQTIIKETKTRVSGFFRKTGEYFQSFSLFTYNTHHTAWLIKADQSFFKDKVGLAASLRRNAFANPFTEKTFKTSTVFKSIQASIRFPKWPTLSVGYYPGSQLYIIDRERVRENVYYIMNASLMHSYKAGSLRMLSSLMYNKYSTKGTDTGFISYKGINYMVSQSLLFNKAQLQGIFMFTDQEQMKYNTIELLGDLSLRSKLRAGAGAKYNKIQDGNGYWGGRVQVSIEFKTLGGLQLQYDKSYLPTIYKTLFPVEMGRVTWYKFF